MMGRLVAAELLKLRTSRTTWGLLLGMFGTILFIVVILLATAGSGAEGFAISFEDRDSQLLLLGQAGVGTVFVLVLGILMMAGEQRHRTITQTFLVTPVRGRVVAAKLAASLVAGLAFAVVALAATLAVVVPWLAVLGIDLDLAHPDVTRRLVGGVVATMLWGPVGLGVGALVRHQTGAIVAALAWVFVVEAAVFGFFPRVGRWLPGQASAALTAPTGPAAGPYLEPLTGAAVFVGYALAFAVLGSRFVVRRDVT